MDKKKKCKVVTIWLVIYLAGWKNRQQLTNRRNKYLFKIFQIFDRSLPKDLLVVINVKIFQSGEPKAAIYLQSFSGNKSFNEGRSRIKLFFLRKVSVGIIH